MHVAWDNKLRRSDWIVAIELIAGAFAIFYFGSWQNESIQAGSWKKGHERLWKKPKEWQLVAVCLLWGFILAIVGVLLLIHPRY